MKELLYEKESGRQFFSHFIKRIIILLLCHSLNVIITWALAENQKQINQKLEVKQNIIPKMTHILGGDSIVRNG